MCAVPGEASGVPAGVSEWGRVGLFGFGLGFVVLLCSVSVSGWSNMPLWFAFACAVGLRGGPQN